MTRIYLSKYYSVVEVFISHMNPHQWPGDPERLLSSLTWAMYVGRNASKLWYELNQCSLTYYSLFKQRDWYTCTMSSMKYARFGFTDKVVFLGWSLCEMDWLPFWLIALCLVCHPPFSLNCPVPKKTCIAVHCTAIHWQLAHSQGQLISILVSRVITSWCHQCSSGCLITPLALIWAFKWFEVRRD